MIWRAHKCIAKGIYYLSMWEGIKLDLETLVEASVAPDEPEWIGPPHYFGQHTVSFVKEHLATAAYCYLQKQHSQIVWPRTASGFLARASQYIADSFCFTHLERWKTKREDHKFYEESMEDMSRMYDLGMKAFNKTNGKLLRNADHTAGTLLFLQRAKGILEACNGLSNEWDLWNFWLQKQKGRWKVKKRFFFSGKIIFELPNATADFEDGLTVSIALALGTFRPHITQKLAKHTPRRLKHFIDASS